MSPSHHAVLLVTAALTASCVPGGNDESRLQITVIVAPACPEQPTVVTAAADCADRPLPDTAVAVIADDRTVTLAVTDQRGQIDVEVPPGDYLVQVEQQPGRVDEPQPVATHVDAGQVTQVTIAIDTGVRDDSAGDQ